MKPRRNDPCSCGSGKKYKNCCLAKERQRNEAPQELAWTRVRRAIDGVGRTLGAFVMEEYGRAAIEQAWDEFMAWDGPAFDPESPLLPIFMPWLYHSWVPDPYDEPSEVPQPLIGRPPTRVFLERRAGRLDPLLERYLEACVATPFSFHEILRCDAGRGFRTRCVLTGQENEVLERMASQSMQVGDVFFGELVPIDGIVLLEACSPYVHSPADKIAIIELREQMEKERPDAEPFPGGPLREWEIEIRELYLALIEPALDPRPPVMQNTDGELIELQRVIFDIDDAERALAALTHGADVDGDDINAERDADGRLERAQFAWNKAGNRMHAR
jgi:SEC-C motif-containing protein